ncbi:MAG: LCP family protein [Acidimicrobiales bacterium]
MSRRRRRGHRSWPQRLLILFNAVLVVACLGAAGLFAVLRQKASELPVVDIGAEVRTQPQDDAPRNILLVGTDNSDSLAKNDPVKKGRGQGEHLADVIMILRVDPQTKEASLLSIPRDTWVPVAPSWSKTKINAAFGGNDGSNQLISTIKHNFGISIDNFVQVDFGGFRELVDVLGGVPTYNEHPVRDPNTGLLLTQTGCIVIDPTQALAYARSRHFEYQAGTTYDKRAKWLSDPTGDLGRISRQQDFLRQAAQRAINEGIRNPTTALGLVNAGLKAVKVDDRMDGGQIVDLIQTFREFSVQNLKSDQIPTVSSGSSKGKSKVSYQEVVWDKAEGLLDVFRGIRGPGEVLAGDVIVGLPPSSAASPALAEALDKAGFDAGTEDTSIESGSGKGTNRPTVIRFGLRGGDAARLLASRLDGDVVYEFSTELPGRRLELIPGTTAPQVRDSALPIDQVPQPTIPQRSTGKGTTTTSAAPTTTTTTIAGGSSATSGKPGSSTTTTSSAVSAPTTSSLDPDVTTTTAIGVVTLNAKAAAQCDG